MTELNGLRNLLVNAGTLHGIQGPPEREDFETDIAYARAYDAWWVRTNCWTATTTELA